MTQSNGHNPLDTVIGGSTATAEVGGMSPENAFQKGQKLFAEGNRTGAIDCYRMAATGNEKPEYRFQLAYLLDLVGEEEEALAIYESLARRDRPHINALINLAVLHEDNGDIQNAEKCLRQVLDTVPDHPRARLFWKDVQASKNMYYDEEKARDELKRSALLDTPVTDFELSVRARNCLKKMEIRTLGDLLNISEAELLSYKNFGETSLTEIKHMLSMKGLRLGQGLEGQYNRVRKEIYEELRGSAPDSVLNKSIAALDLSVRSRKALQSLNIQSIGDLATQTEAELMGVKNFGLTSLDEIKIGLEEYGLGLRSID